jgi:hypothetical protein
MPPDAGQKEDRLAAKFPERRTHEVRRKSLLDNRVNSLVLCGLVALLRWPTG